MRKGSSLILLFAVVLVSTCLYAGNTQADIPGWVKDLASQPLGEYPPRTNAVVLLDETTHSITGPAEYNETHRSVVRILRPEGSKEGSVGVGYDQNDKVLNVHAWSIDPQGKQYEVKEKDFLDVGSWG